MEDRNDPTASQLLSIQDSSAFICAGDTSYVRRLACKIGGTYNQAENVWCKPNKSVIHIYPRSILSYQRIDIMRGRYFREVVVDNQLDQSSLSEEEQDCLRQARERVRGEDYFAMNRSAQAHAAPVAIPMHIYCPMCHTQHIDEGEWATRPHHTHSCQTCGHTWRPAVVCTTGVQFLPGFKNTATVTRKINPFGAHFHEFHIVQAMRDADVLGCVPVVSEWHCGEIMEAVEAMYPAATGFRDLVKKELPF